MNATIYALCEPDTLMVRYVGKTLNLPSRVQCHVREKRQTRKCRWLAKLKREGKSPAVIVLAKVPEVEWRESERWWIARYRALGYDLCNHTDGGDGVGGLDAEARARVSEAAKKRMSCPEYKKKLCTPERAAKISAALKGRPKSKEHVAKLWQNHPGNKKLSEAHKELLRIANTGRKHTPETKLKIGAVHKGNKWGIGNKSRTGQKQGFEERLRKSKSSRGLPKSQAHKDKIQAGLRRSWARRKSRDSLCEARVKEDNATIGADSQQQSSKKLRWRLRLRTRQLAEIAKIFNTRIIG